MWSRCAIFALWICASSASAQQECARRLYELGVSEYQSGRHNAALAAFRESFECTATANTGLMIARELTELSRLGEAHEWYAKVIDLARANESLQQTLETAVTEQAAVAERIGWLRVEVHPTVAAELRVGDRIIDANARHGWIAVSPGRVEVRVAAEGYEPVEQSVVVAVGGREPLSFRLERTPEDEADTEIDVVDPPPPDYRAARIFSWVSFAVGTVAAVIGAVALGRAHGIDRELSDECGGPCPRERIADIDRGQRLETSGFGLLIGGGIVGVVGVVGIAIGD